jgi:hypothetical protein
MRTIPLLTSLALIGMLASCAADSKGTWCGILDMGYSGDEQYCPEADAPERCEEIRDLLIDHIEECGEGAGVTFTPEQLDEIASQLDCEEARALRATEEDCRDAIPEEPCGDNGVPELPDACEGVILDW